MKVVLLCKNDVCVGTVSVNFTMLYFMWFVLHFTVLVSCGCYYHLAFHCWLLINGTVISALEKEREERDKG